MPQPNYPNVTQFLAAFAGTDLADCLPSDVGEALEIARIQWESDTDHAPFLWSGESSPRKFDAPGPLRPIAGRGRVGGGVRLALRAALLSVEHLWIDGEELQPNRDFWLEPANAPAEGEPFTTIRFTRPITSTPQGVTVVGDWGYCRQLPDDVWRAILLRAAWNERETIGRKWRQLGAEAQSKVIKAKESGPVRLEYAVQGSASGEKALDLSETFKAWEGTWERALRGRVMTQP